MSSQASRYATVEEYLTSEENALDRHEYLHGEIYAMVGGTPDHSTVGSNIISTLHSQLQEIVCVVRGPDARIRTSPAGLYTYADVVVSCGKEQFENNLLINPLLIFEVLSDSTESYDRGKKFEYYRQIESFIEYVVVAQSRIYVEHHTRNRDMTTTSWSMFVHTDRNDSISFRAVPATMRLSAVYAKVL